MFFKQSGYKPRPRTGSSSSQGSNSGSTASSTSSNPPKDDSKKNASGTNKASEATGAAGRRRTSSSSDKFAGLTAARTGQDERRASWADQKPGQPGILGGMWASFTKGT